MRQNATLCVFFMVVLSPTTKGPSSSIKQNITTYSHEVLALFVHSLAALKREIRKFKRKFGFNEIKSTLLTQLQYLELAAFLGLRRPPIE